MALIASIVQTRDRARRLRHDLTDAERKLWSRLRGQQLGVKFRRQHPVGPFIADFCCVERRIVIELDGGQHAEPKEREYDRRRAAYLNRMRYRVIRFWDHQVLRETDEVIEQIFNSL